MMVRRTPLVGPARDRDAGDGVEEREREPGEEPHRGVADAEVGLDRLEQDGEDLAVDEVEDVDDEQHAEHVVGVRARVRAGVGRRGWVRGAGGSRQSAAVCVRSIGGAPLGRRPNPNMICATRRIWISSEPSVMR